MAYRRPYRQRAGILNWQRAGILCRSAERGQERAHNSAMLVLVLVLGIMVVVLNFGNPQQFRYKGQFRSGANMQLSPTLADTSPHGAQQYSASLALPP